MQLRHIPAHHETKIHQILRAAQLCGKTFSCRVFTLFLSLFCKNFRKDNKTSFSLKCTLSTNNTLLSERISGRTPIYLIYAKHKRKNMMWLQLKENTQKSRWQHVFSCEFDHRYREFRASDWLRELEYLPFKWRASRPGRGHSENEGICLSVC